MPAGTPRFLSAPHVNDGTQFEELEGITEVIHSKLRLTSDKIYRMLGFSGCKSTEMLPENARTRQSMDATGFRLVYTTYDN